MKVLYAIVGFSLRLCLVPRKYQGKKKKCKGKWFSHVWFHYNFFKKKIKYN